MALFNLSWPGAQTATPPASTPTATAPGTVQATTLPPTGTAVVNPGGPIKPIGPNMLPGAPGAHVVTGAHPVSSPGPGSVRQWRPNYPVENLYPRRAT